MARAFVNILYSEIKYRIRDKYEYEFYFTSWLHYKKFSQWYEYEFRKGEGKVTESLTNRFRCMIKSDVLEYLVHYRNIETRGFRVKINGKEYLTSYDIRMGVNILGG